MATVILAFVVLLIVMAAMAVGVIVQGKPIKGSCGGISTLGMGTACDICGGDQQKCEKETEAQRKQLSEEAKALAYDASRERE